MEIVSGSVSIPPSVSYAAQHPWLESASIRENVLFGSPYIATRYAATIAACALVHDLDVLKDGDATHIGEHGVALSG
jgi:ABC-type multidrug transport system fused ATPase/permease subunit